MSSTLWLFQLKFSDVCVCFFLLFADWYVGGKEPQHMHQ
jgi:hypothetical protein